MTWTNSWGQGELKAPTPQRVLLARWWRTSSRSAQPPPSTAALLPQQQQGSSKCLRGVKQLGVFAEPSWTCAGAGLWQFLTAAQITREGEFRSRRLYKGLCQQIRRRATKRWFCYVYAFLSQNRIAGCGWEFSSKLWCNFVSSGPKAAFKKWFPPVPWHYFFAFQSCPYDRTNTGLDLCNVT